jgi:hypothetical protein
MSIEVYTGMQGAGKTYCMVSEVIVPALRDPRFKVISNLRVSDRRSARETVCLDMSEGFRGLLEVIEGNLAKPPAPLRAPREVQALTPEEREEWWDQYMRALVVAVDELGVAMPSEVWRADPDAAMEVIALALQMRKARCDLVGTVQQFERAAKVFRDNVNLVHKCELRWRHWWKRDEGGPINRKTGRPYLRPFMFEIETVLPRVVNLSSEQARKKGRKEWRKVRFHESVAASYDTYQRIAPLRLVKPGREARMRGLGTPVTVDEVETIAEETARLYAVEAVEADRAARDEIDLDELAEQLREQRAG